MAVPIWKDYYVSLGTGTSSFFRIRLASSPYTVLYSGKSYLRPGETYNYIRINDICADYLVNVLPTLSQVEFSALSFPISFQVQASSDGETWTTKDTVEFRNDWSYDYNYNPTTMGMSFPISNRIDSGMPIVWTGLNVSQVTITIYYKDGVSSQVIIPVALSDDFDSDFNQDFSRSVRSAGNGTAVFFPSAWNNVDRIVMGNTTFKVATNCARYALYYVNAYGGWDSLLIEGNTLGDDSIKRYTRQMVYDNRNIQNRGIQNYVNEITKGFSFHTGWITGDQGERMHHLINSTNVYLYDKSTGEMIPVTIPSTTYQYKTYKDNGNRPVDYTVQVEIAQNRIRR